MKKLPEEFDKLKKVKNPLKKIKKSIQLWIDKKPAKEYIK